MVLIKNGYEVLRSANEGEGVYISQRLTNQYYKYNILDICEWLPYSNYNEYGINLADMVVCSSPLLADLMSQKFPNKKVSYVEDHVDMIDKEWL